MQICQVGYTATMFNPKICVRDAGDHHYVQVDTHIFGNYLVQRTPQNRPMEHLHILLDVSRLGGGELHNLLEKVLRVLAVFRNSLWVETLEVSSNPILLLDLKALAHQPLQ